MDWSHFRSESWGWWSFCCIAFMLLPCALMAATINVPSDQPTLQTGINAAVDFDTVLVAAGTYSGAGNRDVTFMGKKILLMSIAGALSTTVDCGGSAGSHHVGVIFPGGEDSLSILDGFTIRNAFVNLSTDSGAIHCVNSSPTVRNCRLTQNNSAGLASKANAIPNVSNCQMDFNAGYGVVVGDVLWPLAGIDLFECLIFSNGKDGVHVNSVTTVRITNCTIVGNTNAGILLEGDPPKRGQNDINIVNLTNNITANNMGAGIRNIFMLNTVTIRCNDSYGNGAGNWMGVQASAGDTNGNISANPLFCGGWYLGTFEISQCSPCAPANNSCGVLIGAYGTDCSYVCGDLTGDCVADISDVVALIQCIFAECPPDVFFGADADASGVIDISDAVYLIQWIFAGGPPPCGGV